MRPLLCLLIALSLGASALSLGACSPYRPPVQQGNQLSVEQVEAVEAGMTRREVLRLLGYPLLQDPFNADRWDYYYSLNAADQTEQARVLSLWFTEDTLQRINERGLQHASPE